MARISRRRKIKKPGDEEEAPVRKTNVFLDEEALIPLNIENVSRVARAGCSDSEISALFGLSRKEMNDWVISETGLQLSELVEQCDAAGRARLRLAQHNSAMNGDPSILRFIGKNRLSQRDYDRVEVTGKDGDPIEANIRLENLRDRLVQLNKEVRDVKKGK